MYLPLFLIFTNNGKFTNGILTIFTAQCYASAVYAVVVCLPACHKPVLYQNERITQPTPHYTIKRLLFSDAKTVVHVIYK